MNLKQMLEKSTEQYSAKIAIISDNRRLSYAELDGESNKVSNYLTKIGIKKGDCIAILLTNSLEYVVLYLGIIKISAIAVPLDVKYKTDELNALLNHCQPKMLISESPYLDSLIPILNRYDSIKYIIDVSGRSGEKFTSYRDIIEQGSADRITTEPNTDDTAVIAYTSGPTFRPKGVVLTHHNLVAEARISAEGFQQTDRDISTLFALPLHHVFGLVGILLTTLYSGGTILLIPGLSLGGALETISKEKATMFMGVPYIYALMANIAKNDGISNNLSCVRIWGSSGAPLTDNIIKDFKQYFGRDLINFWGLSEASCHITCPPLNGEGVSGSVGKALPGWEIKIVDNNEKEQSPNHDGEIIIKGMPVMKEYYHNLSETLKTLKNGWLHTGDIGRVDNDGYLFITGRKKNMIIRKGQNIYPSDIEDLLSTHPQIAESAVIGTVDNLRGEELKAFIRLKQSTTTTEREIRQFCLEHLASYKVPKHITITELLPRTANGEIDQQSLMNKLPLSSS